MSKPVTITFNDRIGHWDDADQQPDGGRKVADSKPGEACWMKNLEGKPSVLAFSCPCGCQEIVHVPLAINHGGQGWEWNGSEDKPTTRPSILRTTGCRWHGYLTDGIFTSC